MIKSYFDSIRGYSKYLLFAITNLIYSVLGQTFIISLFVPDIIKEFSLDYFEFGLIYSLTILLGTLFYPYIGKKIDLHSLKHFCYFIGTVYVVGLMICGVSTNIFSLFCGLLIIRLAGPNLMGHTAGTSLARYFKNARGKAIGILSLGNLIGDSIVPIIVAKFLFYFSWKDTFYILGIICLFTFIPIIFFLIRNDDPFIRPPLKSECNVQESVSSRREVLKSPYFYMIFPVVIIPGFLLTSLFFYHTWFATMKGQNIHWIASSFAVFGITRVIGALFVGPYVDKYKAKKLLPFYPFFFIFGLLILIFIDHWTALIVSYALIGLSIGCGNTIKGCLWAEIYGTKHLGAIHSMIGTIMLITISASTPIFGYIIDANYSVNYILLISVVLILLSSLMAFWANRWSAYS